MEEEKRKYKRHKEEEDQGVLAKSGYIDTNIDENLGIEDRATVHKQKLEKVPKTWEFRVQSKPASNKHGAHRYKVANRSIVVLKGLEPNPVHFDHDGISEYLPEKTYEYLIKCGYKKYVKEE